MNVWTPSRTVALALGPSQIVMRLLAPLFVAATVVLFGSGGLHTLGYLGRALRRTGEDVVPARRNPVRGIGARALALTTVVVLGLALGGADPARPAPLGRSTASPP